MRTLNIGHHFMIIQNFEAKHLLEANISLFYSS